MLRKSDFDSLVARKLAVCRVKDGLAIYKYSKRVFFDNLWDEDPMLAYARGIVFDIEGNLIVRPFVKVFNFGEKDTGVELLNEARRNPNTIAVWAVHKVNGFMASVTLHNEKMLVTTSGSLDSPFVELATRVLIDAGLTKDHLAAGTTYLFEITDPSDPHVISEKDGAWLIGAMNVGTGELMPEPGLDVVAEIWSKDTDVLRPASIICYLNRLEEMMEACQTEGVMVRDAITHEPLFKWKSKHYLRLKFLSRATFFLKEDFDRTKLKASIEEEFHGLVDRIFDEYGVEAFKALDPPTRVELLKGWL